MYIQDFTNGIPGNWVTYTEAGFDFVTDFGGEANMFKQSSGDEILMIGTEQLNLGDYSKFEVDMYAFNLAFNSDTKPDIHIGVWTDPSDKNSFQALHVVNVANEQAQTYEVYIGGITGMGHLALKMVGEKSQITYLDNWHLYNDNFEANHPLAVSNLAMTPGPLGSSEVNISWTNPSLEADGDPLMELTSIQFLVNGTSVYTHNNPTIGADDAADINLPFPGYYRFEVIPVNSAGNGHSVFTETTWIGLDFPAAPLNVQILNSGPDVEISWEPPTMGSNGAYFDGVITSYSIFRSDGGFYSIPGNVTSFSETLDILGTVDYKVQANNSSGDGDQATTDAIHYDGDDFLLYDDLYVDIVNSPGDPILNYDFAWNSVSTTPQSYWTWFSSDIAGKDNGEFALISSNSFLPNQEVRLVSPVLNTSGLPAIIIEFTHYHEPDNNTSYSWVLETTSDGGNTWNEVQEWIIDQQVTEDIIKSIANADVGSDQFQFSITMKGNTQFPGVITRVDNIRAYFQATTDVAVFDFNSPTTYEPGNALPFSADIVNNSTSVVNCVAKCTVKERFGSNVLYENEVPLNNMNVGEIINVSFGSWNTVEGEYVVEISAQNDDDGDPENDIWARNLNVFQLGAREVVVIEEFTGTWCTYCPGAALGIEDLYALNKPVAAIAYHRSDPYETPNVQGRMDLYSVFGFPTVMIDGLAKITGGHQSQSVVDQYLPDVDERAAQGSPVSFEFTHADLNTGIYDVTVKVNSLSPIQNPNLKLYAVIVESEIQEDWLGLTQLDFTERAMAEATINLSSNSDELSFQFSLDPMINTDHTELTVFVQDMESLEIWNGSVIHLNTKITSTEEEIYDPLFEVYPNPFSNEFFIKLELDSPQDLSIRLLNVFGQAVFQTFIQKAQYQDYVKINPEDLSDGIYYLELDFEGKKVIKKINSIH